MFVSLPQLLPQSLPAWLVILLAIVVLALDVLLVGGIVVLGAAFTAFRLGKLIYDKFIKLIDQLVHRLLCFLEDILESPPLDRAPFLSLVLVGVKMAYDLINGAQRLIETLISIAVALLAFILVLSCGLWLLVINAAAVWMVVRYLL